MNTTKGSASNHTASADRQNPPPAVRAESIASADHPVLNPAITTAWLLRHEVVPVRWRMDGALEVLMVDPFDFLVIDVLAAVHDRAIIAERAEPGVIRTRLMERAACLRETVAELAGSALERNDALLERNGIGNEQKSAAQGRNGSGQERKGASHERAVAGYERAVTGHERNSASLERNAALQERNVGDAGKRLTSAGELLGGDPEEPAVIRVVNAILADAFDLTASDVHLEPMADGLKVRYRIDGLLEDRDMLPDAFREPVVGRIQVMARMDVSNRRQPQDGAFDVTFGGHPVDVRVSTIPTPAGQRVVMRLLDRSGRTVTLETLGMQAGLVESIRKILQRTQGLFLVAGPTGSGKTTTLYACLNRLDIGVRNTITIEDPVEYHVAGVSQVQVGRDRNLGFADGLRSILRQDPDVIMVGEIRDGDTAATALQAALTGHLILSTIHTMDPASAVIRLLDLGVEPPLIAETLAAVMDQRLVRTLCPHCAKPAGTERSPQRNRVRTLSQHRLPRPHRPVPLSRNGFRNAQSDSRRRSSGHS